MIDTSTHMEQIHFISKPSGETDPPDRVETPRAGDTDRAASHHTE